MKPHSRNKEVQDEIFETSAMFEFSDSQEQFSTIMTIILEFIFGIECLMQFFTFYRVELADEANGAGAADTSFNPSELEA